MDGELILFWLCALAVVVVALGFVLPPLLRPGRTDDDTTTRNLALYRSRLAALDEEHRLGAISDADLAQARDELGRELLADTRAATPVAPGTAAKRSGGARIWLAIVVGVGVPLLSVALYQHLGDPGAVGAAPRATAVGAGAGAPPVEDMVAALAERLASQPDDSEGWLLLGRSYMALERYADAADALRTAHRLLGDSPSLLSDIAEAAALADGRNFLGAPGELLERALALDPGYPKALWLGAFSAMQRGETTLAAQRWQALLERQPPDSEAAGVLRGLIANARSADGDRTADGNRGGAGAGPAITVNVTVADRLVAGLDGGETLYVFARAPLGPPVAVARRRASDLPLTVTLDDSMAMAGGRKLSDVDRVVIGARIAMGGTATASSGDLQGFSEPLPVTGDATVGVVISERVP